MGTPVNPGWVNTQTPSFATVYCGFVQQTQSWTTTGSTVALVGFDGLSSWTTPNWENTDLSGWYWRCNLAGIYQVAASQNLTVFNAADATNPVVNVTLTVTSITTSEFNNVFTTSIAVPITTAPIVMNVLVSGLTNVDVGSEMHLSIESLSGNVDVTSGATTLPAPNAYMSWNLIAQGSYGNVGTIV